MSTATYVLLGLQGSSTGRSWDTEGSLSFGNGLQQGAGRWFWSDITVARNWSRKKLASRFGTTFSGLRYTAPFSYGAYTTQLEPAVTWNATTSASITVTPRATGGFWTSAGENGSIGVIGSSIAFAQSFGGVTAQLSSEVNYARNGALNGNFAGIGFDVLFTRGRFDLGAGIKRWHYPGADEWGYNAYASRSFGKTVRADVQLARSVRDPVLATPGTFGASVALNWRVGHAREKGAPEPLYAVNGTTPKGRRVTFMLKLPSAKSVAVSGSFSDWNPVPMRRKGNLFTAVIEVRPGTYQFGFLVDGETWYLPPNASGVVNDDFGRKNATLVI